MSNTIAGKLVEIVPRSDGDVLTWNETNDVYVHLAANAHDHDVGDLEVLFENRIV